MSRVRAAAPLLLVLAAQAAILVPVALRRVIDPDEGWYALAAVRVTRGETPYLDFFYPQMPLLPYVFGAWTAIFGESWYAERLCASALAIAVGTIVFLRGRSLAGTRAAVAGTSRYVKWTQTLTVPAGLYQVRVAVRDRQTARTGSAMLWIEIPGSTIAR